MAHFSTVVYTHTWLGFTYDPEQKQLLFMNTWVTNQKKAVEQLGGDPEQLYAGPPLWAFYMMIALLQLQGTDVFNC